MNASIEPAARAAFNRLIDYAGLFPPAKLATGEALAEYAAARNGTAAWMLGRFIVPASGITEVAELWAARRERDRLPLSVIAGASSDPRSWFASLQNVLADVARARTELTQVDVEAIEIPIPVPSSARETFDAPIGQLHASLDRAGLRDLPAYVELPNGPRWTQLSLAAMPALARVRLNAKIRCGGVVAEAFPPVADVAAFVAAASAEGVAFKATAGLHHPVRHRDPATGFVMHGFFNLLAAAAFAPRVSRDELVEIVAEEDARAFDFDDASLRWRDRRAELDEVARMRAAVFAGYGSCSFSEPVDDLTALRFLPSAAV
jgi:hypothetical protein